jgi:light-regulated signal transduction histidine kinase (bacteriophytochrome)
MICNDKFQMVERADPTSFENVDAEVLFKLIAILKQSNQQLEQKNEDLQTFAYALVHDLSTPLSIISSFAELLSFDNEAGSKPQDQEYVGNILKAATQMKQFICNLLEYLSVGHQAVRHQSIAMHELLSQVARALRTRLDETQAELCIPVDLPMVEGDPILLSRIFMNLFSNALTYRRHDIPPKITVKSIVEMHYASIGVSDNGIGIAPQDYDRIFTILQRLHNKEQYPGTGIGLTFVKKAAELMNGQIWVESVVGEGSIFWVRLPLP